jgi:hypothetical protein
MNMHFKVTVQHSKKKRLTTRATDIGGLLILLMNNLFKITLLNLALVRLAKNL